MQQFHTILGASYDATFDVALTREERLKHVAIFGMTGVGKTTLLTNIVTQDIARGDGLMLLDPNGDFAEFALGLVPRQRANHVCYLNLADTGFPVGFNVLEDVEPDTRDVLASSIVSAFMHIWPDAFSPSAERILLHAVTALIEVPSGTLMLLRRLLTDDNYRAPIVARLQSPITRGFFEHEFELWDADFRERCLSPILNKVDVFAASTAIRHVLGQPRSTLHLERAMQNARIIIVNTSKGLIGDKPAFLMGGLLLARIKAAGMARASLPPDQRRPFHLIIDEAHSYSTDAIVSLLQEARKYGLSVVLATQYMKGLPPATQAAIRGSLGTLVVFRVGVDDAELFAPEFNRLHEQFNPTALYELGVGQTMARLPEWYGQMNVPPAPQHAIDPETIRKQSRRHYSRPRPKVEPGILAALAPKSARASK